MAVTRTGSFPIGFRCNCPWQESSDAAIGFALEHGFEAIDVSARPPEELRRILDAGLHIGSVDVPWPWGELAASDAARRRDAVDVKAAYITSAVQTGVRLFFLCAFPDDETRPRHESFTHLVDGLGRLCQAVSTCGARLVLEGYPGNPPRYPTFGCTPADLRLLFAELGDQVLSINFDPSHLIRMGIDPLRFVKEFARQIHHVHAKDTQLLADGLYEHGNLQPATQAEPHPYGGHHWRYTIPGHGCTPWTGLLQLLAESGYHGAVSIELEDENYNGAEKSEKQGFLESKTFLESV